VVIAGPCAVESAAQTLAVADAAKAAGADMLRGGAFKTRTSPYDFQGLGKAALEILVSARESTGLPFVTEVLDPREVEATAEAADMLQVGTRNMHNTPLLKELGQSGKPVLLKRGWASTLNEWLSAAEYVAHGGNEDIVLCERGIRIDPKGLYAHPAIDFEVVRQLREATHLPVIIDPSHGTEDAEKVPMACDRALAAGVDGLIVEVLPSGWSPERVRCDGHQSITPEVLADIVGRAKS
jgi:3-deoxy-7-phosphoheptulonate synthase